MIPTVLLILQLALTGAQPLGTGCGEKDVAELDAARGQMARGDTEGVRAGLRAGTVLTNDQCRAVTLARASLRGWLDARAAAPKGGSPESLAPVIPSLREIETIRSGDLALEAEYAGTSIRAAMAAAQDERPEMELLISHARDLAERLTARGRRATWPKPFNLLAGELWFEVDRYEDARVAFDRAARADDGGLAHLGLARSYARLGRQRDACAAYRQVRGLAEPLQAETRTFLAGCQ